MGWSVRTVLHRARAQVSLLSVVAAVALLTTTLLGTFTLLLTTTQERMVPVALADARTSEREIDVIVSPRTGGGATLTRMNQFIDDTLSGVPSSRETWVSSVWYSVSGTADPMQPYVYLASEPEVARRGTLLSGAYPTTPVDDSGRVLVAVPQVAADAYGWTVGTVVDAGVAGQRGTATLVVTGTFELSGPANVWGPDPLGGTQQDASYPVLGSAGVVTTRAWGPLVTAGPDVLTDGTVRLDTAHVVATPDLGAASVDELAAMRAQLELANPRLAGAMEQDDAETRVTTRLTRTIDAAVSALRVTQITVIVVALLLVVLAVTVLLNAARLLTERRAPEQRLLASRGATSRQLIGLAALEASCLALFVAVLAPWLARALYLTLTADGPMRESGLHVDPGLPAALWVASVGCAVALAAVLLGPALRKPRAAEGRADRNGALARSGADIALLVLAAVAFQQLRTYKMNAGPPGEVDPVLVIAPALILLAAAVLVLRVLPLLTRAGERVAARSRALTSPLAAWELGRRPGRAAGAVVLLTLAVGVGTFSLSFLSTWRSSQQDQADLAIGTDVRITPADDTALAGQTATLPGVRVAAPVSMQDAMLGKPHAVDVGGSTSVSAALLAVDTTHADELLRGRIAGGWAARTRELRATTPVGGVPLTGTPRYLLLDLEAATTGGTVAGGLQTWVVLQYPSGERVSLQLPATTFGTGWDDVVVRVPEPLPGMSLVAVLLRGTPDSGASPPAEGVTLTGVLANVRTAAGPVPVPGSPLPTADQLEDVTPVDLSRGAWDPAGGTTHVESGAVRARTTPLSQGWYGGPVTAAATTFADPGQDSTNIGVLVTPDLLDTLATEVGRPMHLTVPGAEVDVEIVGTIPYLPGHPAGNGILVDADLFGRAAMAASFPPPPANEWWLAADDARADAVAAAVEEAGDGVARSRVQERTAATDGPLRIGVQAALWVVVAASLLLAVAGIAMSATVSVRTRRLELARLQALGAARASLVRSLLLEHVVVAALGLVAGVAVGTFLARAVAPLVTVSPTGGSPVPGVVVAADWPAQVALVGTLLGLTAVVVAVVTNGLLKRASGELLKLGDDR